ncbi:putative mitochondrial inheritance component mdm12 [Phaeomoniella chlamydospora]|uniref:Mitochondrial distribution and morphology protein 12 n=1 Tax=Phaeomoniella chlamydospora TaxID=158046 RepID=A0A0G2F0A9_PHACM|nr:putative mitochondrial inheritance component mdm12 [Phaeomoniella chlamydospora]
MSIDIKWDTITSGPDGDALAEKIRSFVHDKFQQVTLPRFIRSVQVHSFDFGKVCPELEIKDICDPLPDFYEDDEEDDDEEVSDVDHKDGPRHPGSISDVAEEQELQQALKPHNGAKSGNSRRPPSIVLSTIDPRLQTLGSPFHMGSALHSPFRSGTPGIPGGTSNLSYFHLPLGGISGTQTPLAAVAGGTPFPRDWNGHSHSHGHGHDAAGHETNQSRSHSHDGFQSASNSRPSTAVTIPQSPESLAPTESIASSLGADIDMSNDLTALDSPSLPSHMRERRPDDIQVVCRVKYSGDVRMALTAEILLDYPMPSFVGIPLKLSITGLKFDGVAILAYIRKRAHFCFLSPEDAHALVGDDQNHDADDQSSSGERRTNSDQQPQTSLGGLLQQIEVESEIGKKENGKQVLKNVSKVEKFVLEQVRRIFEEEFVFPSFWTFLV